MLILRYIYFVLFSMGLIVSNMHTMIFATENERQISIQQKELPFEMEDELLYAFIEGVESYFFYLHLHNPHENTRESTQRNKILENMRHLMMRTSLR